MKTTTGELVELKRELTPEQALERGLVPVPPEDVERVQAMTEEERLEYARGLVVRTQKPTGAVRVQAVAPLMDRGLKARAERNRRRRERQGRAEAPKLEQAPRVEEARPAGWVALR